MQFGIGTLDLIVIVVYLMGIAGFGCWVGLRHRRQGGQSKDYFLAGVFAFLVSLSGSANMENLHWLHDGLIAALGGGSVATTIVDMHWMVASFWLCMVCLTLHVVVSLITPEKLTEEKAALVWRHPLDALSSPGWRGVGNYKVLSALLFAALVLLYAILG